MMEGSTVADLERRLREAERRVEQERQRAEHERQRAEEAERGREVERERAEKEQQRAEQSERQTQPTTLDEYIAACHTSVFSRLSVETDSKFTSKGPITNPRDKWCPSKLQPWSDFLEKQRTVLGTLNATFPIETRVFENKSFLEGMGERISSRKIADEKTLEYFLHNSVEDPVRNIIEKLKNNPETSNAFDMNHGIVFENHPHAISDVAEEVADRETPSTPPKTPNQRQDPHQLRADQICIYRSDSTDSSERTMLYISEYKPPHKLTAPHLRLGLRPMDIYKEVVNRRTIPTSVDAAARFQYFAERLTASAITQTYHYMIEGGLEYSLLTTGETIVFLTIDWDDPGTLYYHLAEPGPEAAARPDQLHLCSSVGQYLAFTLLALVTRTVHGQEERQRATQTLHTWAEDFETTVRSIPDSERTAASDASFIPEPTTYQDVDRSPIFQRLRRRIFPQDQCGDRPSKVNHPPESSDDDESSSKPPETPTPSVGDAGARRSQRILARRSRGGGSQRGGKGADDVEAGTEEKTDAISLRDGPYCTQACLLGLVKGQKLDPTCPNVDLHRRNGDHHPVDHAQWLSLLHRQLEQSLDDGITPLGHGGARGVLFRVTLLAYGYTFVSKGTVRAFIPDLEHEADVYKRLLPAQGRNVPVFLGVVDLRQMRKIYYYDHRVYVVYLTFLSWAGCSISEAEAAGFPRAKLHQMAMQSLRAIHRYRVRHKDVRDANMLFNRETGVMMIDFERAEMLDLQRQPLAPVVPNKRVRVGEGRRGKQLRKMKMTMGRQEFSSEVGELEAIFARADGYYRTF
ncbi:uncharacterized protein F5Z01DRAFT_430295 [Emericellopsis atlantica]|uniref:Uncharacterized protein n=1 Tax=Emericellopsis atlantica TaxID=2614577 RepID=A0A9P7ZEG2_9HYPO|nr:uncharacterized protein F5Z01DRAFT_430295 [Emericellopsis atlantica]KAG9250055.1 hypothetical protein F5Z01DRAFT_430295 [Emericellopsis atlantica]